MEIPTSDYDQRTQSGCLQDMRAYRQLGRGGAGGGGERGVVDFEREGEDIGEEKENHPRSIEMAYKGKEIPSWANQLSLRAFFVSFVLGSLFSGVVIKQVLTTGMIPPVKLYAGIVGFSFAKFFEINGILKEPVTRQETAIIQTCVIAMAGIASSGGLGDYILGMTDAIAKQTQTNYGQNTKKLSLKWIFPFMFVSAFLGIFAMVPFRKIMLIDFKLIFPSGTAYGNLINTIHAPLSTKFARKQVQIFAKYFIISLAWSSFSWLYAGLDQCGFRFFPTFGVEALKRTFTFTFGLPDVATGMMCRHITSFSMLIGAILSQGIVLPIVEKKAGEWYSADLPRSSNHGLYAYKLFPAVSMFLGDGLYNLVKALIIAISHQRRKEDLPVTGDDHSASEKVPNSYNERIRIQVFLSEHISTRVAISLYVALAAISTAVIPVIFPSFKWYYAVVIYAVAPSLAFCKIYGTGLTNLALSTIYSRLVMFVIGGWAGASNGSILVAIVAFGVVVIFCDGASDLMMNFRTGYLTLVSPKSLFISHIIGTAMGCVISPCIFWYMYKAHPDLGQTDSAFPASYASNYRKMAATGIGGLSALPKHCLTFCYACFALAILFNLIRDGLPEKLARFVPLPIVMAMTFIIGAQISVCMCVGSLILLIWKLKNRTQAENLAPVVASALITGDGLWNLPASIFALVGIKPPMCMKVFTLEEAAAADAATSSKP